MKQGFTVPAQLMGIRSMTDGGMGLSFHTKELPPDEKAAIMAFHLHVGWLLFKGNEIAETDIPTTMAEKDAKSPSQRLRGVLYILYTKEKIQGDFEEFYRIRMEKIINMIKEKLT